VEGILEGNSYEALLRQGIPQTLRALNMRSPCLIQDHAPPHRPENVQDTIEELAFEHSPTTHQTLRI